MERNKSQSRLFLGGNWVESYNPHTHLEEFYWAIMINVESSFSSQQLSCYDKLMKPFSRAIKGSWLEFFHSYFTAKTLTRCADSISLMMLERERVVFGLELKFDIWRYFPPDFLLSLYLSAMAIQSTSCTHRRDASRTIINRSPWWLSCFCSLNLHNFSLELFVANHYFYDA
jgi:hypothetical protein